MDKGSIAALTATLQHYARGEAEREVPVWRMIALPVADVQRRATAWAAALVGANTVEGRTMVGGGSLPGESLPTVLLALDPRPGDTVDALAARLRTGDPAVVARIDEGRVVLDPRTVDPADDGRLLGAARRAWIGV